jgi:16S rRNA processing protein RimM
LKIGQIVGAHGIRGQVKVEAVEHYLSRFAVGQKLLLEGRWLEIETFAIHKGRPLIKLAGISTMTAAQALQWKYVEVEDDAANDLGPDEFLAEDLIGMAVRTTEGRELGEIDDVISSPAHDILVIGEVLVPAIREFVTMIDFEAETVTVKLIPGMLDDD